MSITIKISNQNEGKTLTTNVYRSDEPFNYLTKPAVLATVGSNITQYVDETALPYTLYYYAVEQVSTAGKSFSNCKPYADTPVTGPGNSTILRGDARLGYMGDVTQALFATFAEFKTLTGHSGNTVTAASNWKKFTYKGKIVFVPYIGVANDITWASIYQLGLVYGTDDNGRLPPEVESLVTPTNQLKTIEVKGLNYKVRMAGASNDDEVTRLNRKSDLKDSEVMDLILSSYSSLGLNPARTIPEMSAYFVSTTNCTGVMTRHFDASVTNGVLSFNTGVNANDYFEGTTLITSTTGSSRGVWIPILELIPE